MCIIIAEVTHRVTSIYYLMERIIIFIFLIPVGVDNTNCVILAFKFRTVMILFTDLISTADVNMSLSTSISSG